MIPSLSPPTGVGLPNPAAFLAAERLLAPVQPAEVELYGAIEGAARALVPLDAFYVCLVQRGPDILHFVYNCEGDHFDTPEPYPFGDGPTSRVAKSGCPVVIAEAAHRAEFALTPFADDATQTASAVHWPLWIDADPAALPDGVLSVQAYPERAYGDAHLAAVEWLALRAADAIRRHRAAEGDSRACEAAALAAARARAVEDVRRFVGVLHGLAALRDDPPRLLAEVRRQQVALTAWAPASPLARDEVSEALLRLSSRELEVLAYVAQGMGNEEVAEALVCSKHTVKRHLDNVYAGGVLTRRAEIANAAPAIQAAWMARKGH